LENIVVGAKDPSQIYLIDFGLASIFMDKAGQHIEKMFLGRFSGNFLFSSLNSCRGNTKSRRDDIEAIIYIMIYLLNNRHLPWIELQIKLQEREADLKTVLLERLKVQYTKALVRYLPSTPSHLILTLPL